MAGKKDQQKLPKRTRTAKVKAATPKKLTAKGNGGQAPRKIRALAAGAPADPLGACSWIDNSGQPQCQVMTQSACKTIPKSTFDPGKQC